MQTAADLVGEHVSLRNCVVGHNLNLVVIRGFARMDVLAAISAADVYDQVDNPLGTQRDLTAAHSQQVLEYALGALDLDSATQPRAFPEIILNVRDVSLLTIVDPNSDEEFDPQGISDLGEGQIADVRIDASRISLQDEKDSRDPSISRVDGNHRLSRVKAALENGEEDFPTVPFAMFVDLSADQERALFKDINGNQKPMSTAHLSQIEHRLQKDLLLLDDKKRSLYIAMQLTEPNGAFAGMVFHGGSKTGVKRETGGVPPIRLNALRGAVQQSLSLMRTLELQLVYDGDPDQTQVSEEGVLMLTILLDRYWKAVAHAYPEAWQDRKGYILLQAIGLNAFSRLAAEVITRAAEEGKTEQADFNLVLDHVSKKVQLDRDLYPGLAGLAGARVIADKLATAMDQDFSATKLKASLLGEEPSVLDQ